MHPSTRRRPHSRRRIAAPGLVACAVMLGAGAAQAQMPVTSCDAAGIGAARLQADGPPVTILSAAAATTAAPGSVPYCLVQVRVPQAINIWVGLPMGKGWNGHWQSIGGGVYAGSAMLTDSTTGRPAVESAVASGYASAVTDTGHADGPPRFPPFLSFLDGSFGCVNNCAGNNAANPGKPDVALQTDFAYRSEHLMAVIGKQLVQAFYGKAPNYSYWNGCSTGGRQGLRMAQDFPGDYDGILAGAPAIHWDRFQAAQSWHWLVQQLDNHGPIGGGDPAILAAKEALATNRAVAVCDAYDGVVDGVLTDPRNCRYSASNDRTITRASCAQNDKTCLSPTEAMAIDKMWKGPVSCGNGNDDRDDGDGADRGRDGDRDGDGRCRVRDVADRNLRGEGAKRLWYGQTRGADLSALGGVTPFIATTEQARYWVYFDPTWDPLVLNYDNYLSFFRDNVSKVGPLMASDNPDLSGFRKRGGKLVMWHGFADQLIVPGGSIDYYDAVTQRTGGSYRQTQSYARLFMAPGVGHCGGGNGPQPQGLLDAVVNWVERGRAPDTITASKATSSGATQTRPLCPYPTFAKWTGRGSSDDAANFVCR